MRARLDVLCVRIYVPNMVIKSFILRQAVIAYFYADGITHSATIALVVSVAKPAYWVSFADIWQAVVQRRADKFYFKWQ